MPTDYSRFQASIQEIRSYYDEWCNVPSLIAEVGIPKSAFKITDRTIDADVSGSHVMNPGHPDPAARFNDFFHFKPPDDFIDFYHFWNGGFLLYRTIYRLLSMEDVVAINDNYRQLRKHAVDAPWLIIRFADLGNGDYIGYRLKDGRWTVGLLLHDYHDDDLLAGDFEAPILSHSFSGWIDRLIELDGAVSEYYPSMLKRI